MASELSHREALEPAPLKLTLSDFPTNLVLYDRRDPDKGPFDESRSAEIAALMDDAYEKDMRLLKDQFQFAAGAAASAEAQHHAAIWNELEQDGWKSRKNTEGVEMVDGVPGHSKEAFCIDMANFRNPRKGKETKRLLSIYQSIDKDSSKAR